MTDFSRLKRPRHMMPDDVRWKNVSTPMKSLAGSRRRRRSPSVVWPDACGASAGKLRLSLRLTSRFG